jgi:hypothetical protein
MISKLKKSIDLDEHFWSFNQPDYFSCILDPEGKPRSPFNSGKEMVLQIKYSAFVHYTRKLLSIEIFRLSRILSKLHKVCLSTATSNKI